MFTLCHFHKDAFKPTHLIPERPVVHNSDESVLAYQNLSVIRKLGSSRFPVYLVQSEVNNERYAMKVFPYVDSHPNRHFNNEARFAFLKHPNVIKIVHCEIQREAIHKEEGEANKVSYILMEYAPFGDFFNLIRKHKDKLDEKLVRTYFRQLIDGIEYLHKNGVSHLDLKPENLMIGQDFNLKIVDFDLSYLEGDQKILSRGTRNYRAPEIIRCPVGSKTIFAADIYSAGVVLFLLKNGGIYPHCEQDGPDFGNLQKLMYHDNSKFWKKHCEIEGKEARFFDGDFKELFNHMVKEKPNRRMTIKQIKKSKWYNGPVYSYVELCEKMKKLLAPPESSAVQNNK